MKVSEVIDAVISRSYRIWSSGIDGYESKAPEILSALSEAGYVVVSRETLRGALEIAELAMPDSYLASDSRVEALRRAMLATAEKE